MTTEKEFKFYTRIDRISMPTARAKRNDLICIDCCCVSPFIGLSVSEYPTSTP